MKTILFIICGLFFSNVYDAQSICYFYDAAGNRTTQSIECVGAPPPNDDDVDKSMEDVALLSKVYPNPSYGLINIEIPKEENIEDKSTKENNKYAVQVLDESGKTILNEQFENRNHQIDLTSVAVGRYFVKLNFNGIEESWQIIKN